MWLGSFPPRVSLPRRFSLHATSTLPRLLLTAFCCWCCYCAFFHTHPVPFFSSAHFHRNNRPFFSISTHRPMAVPTPAGSETFFFFVWLSFCCRKKNTSSMHALFLIFSGCQLLSTRNGDELGVIQWHSKIILRFFFSREVSASQRSAGQIQPRCKQGKFCLRWFENIFLSLYGFHLIKFN